MCHGLNPFHTNNLTDGFVPMVNVMKVMNLKNCDKRLLWVEEKMNERRNFFCRNIQMHFIKKDNPKFYIQPTLLQRISRLHFNFSGIV